MRVVRPTDSEAVIALGGVLDLTAGDVLAHVVDAAVADGAARVVLDLSDLDFVDAAGVGRLVGARNLAAGAGALLVVRSPSEAAARILELTGLAALLGGYSAETASTIDSSR